MSPDEDVISLVVECDDLTTLNLWLWWEKRAKEMRCQQTEWSAKVVQDELGSMGGRVAVSRHPFGVDPV